MQRHPFTAGATWGAGSESRSISILAHGQMRLCFKRAVIRGCVDTHLDAPATTDISQAQPCCSRVHLSRGPKEGSARWATAIEGCITHGDCCPVWLLISSCCGPQTQNHSAPGPHLSVSVGSTPAPSSAHSAHTLVHAHVHIHVRVHIRTALTPSFLLSFRLLVLALVLVLVMLLVDSLCPSASLVPCYPAALLPALHRAAWSGTGQPILSVSRPPPGRIWLGDGTSPPLQACRPIGSFSIHKALRQATINKPVGSMSCSPAQPSSLAPVCLHPSLPYHE